MTLKKVHFVLPRCAQCGNEVRHDAVFCGMCGAPITRRAISTPPTVPHQGGRSSSLFDRMIRAARLDPMLFEEVEADETATTQALSIVALASICSGIGNGIQEALTGSGLAGISVGLFGGLVMALIGWGVWSFVTYMVGSRIFGGTASFSELLRTIGFSNTPSVLLIFSFLPFVGGLLSFAVSLWGLVAMVIAVRQALDFSTGKAIITCVVGWIAQIILLVIIGLLLALPFIIFGL